MEVAASITSLLSLAVHLVQSVDTIKNFIKDVKHAPEKLRRITETLERLGSLLEEVRNVLELQHSPLFPQPSSSMEKGLDDIGCHLRPLREVVEEYKTIMHEYRCGRAMTWRKISLVLSSKRITEIEGQLKRDITFLGAALMTNCTSIQLSSFSTIIEHQHLILDQQSNPTHYTTPKHRERATTIEVDYPSDKSSELVVNTYNPKNNTGIRYSGIRRVRRKNNLHPILRKLGFETHDIITYAKKGQRDPQKNQGHQTRCILLIDCVYSWGSSWFSRRVEWRPASYGSILPTLSVYPIDPNLCSKYDALIKEGTVEDLKAAISTGQLHPFAQDVDRWNLLHVAANNLRVDMCQTLAAFGVRFEELEGTASHLLGAIYVSDWTGIDLIIDIIRLVLETFQFTDEFPWKWFGGYVPPALARWLWACAPEFLEGPELGKMGETCVDGLLLSVRTKLSRGMWVAVQYPSRDIDLQDSMDPISFERSCSFEIGMNWLRVISREGSNIDDHFVTRYDESGYILNFRDNHENEYRRRLDFTCDRSCGSGFHWETVCDSESAGYPLISIFEALALHRPRENRCYHPGESYDLWPYSHGTENEDDNWRTAKVRAKRWERRTARKAPKAQKQPKRSNRRLEGSRMPGSWAWD